MGLNNELINLNPSVRKNLGLYGLFTASISGYFSTTVSNTVSNIANNASISLVVL
ncbi:MAG: hypothetical protein ACI935_003860 [Moritella dasanensis]|jgi:hypothetical protein